MNRLILLVVLALLAACGDDAPAADDSRAASGEVLEGTISDAMLPVDRVRSQPPLAEPEARATGGGQTQPEAAEGEAGEAEAPVEGEEAPDEDPAAEAE